MMVDREELILRGKHYCQTRGLVLGEPLGYGIHGIVFVVERQAEFGSTAMKVHERESPYVRERNVYRRLTKHDISDIRGCKIPRLIEYDDDLWVLEMEVVTRPFVLDFAGAYLDHPPDYGDEVLDDWRAAKEEQFGDSWPEVEAILWSLKCLGIHLVDVSPNNIAICE
jgi:hypothetical protein